MGPDAQCACVSGRTSETNRSTRWFGFTSWKKSVARRRALVSPRDQATVMISINDSVNEILHNCTRITHAPRTTQQFESESCNKMKTWQHDAPTPITMQASWLSAFGRMPNNTRSLRRFFFRPFFLIRKRLQFPTSHGLAPMLHLVLYC